MLTRVLGWQDKVLVDTVHADPSWGDLFSD